MSGTTSVPSITFGATGPVAPTEPAILAGVQADINASFGGGLNPDLTTPQGQLAQSMTAIIGDANSQLIALANNFDPAYASGRYQDALGRIYFLERTPAEPTTVTATCTGLAGVIIPVGAKAQAADGNTYLCTQAGTIPVGGSIDLPFACAQTGPITCPAGALATIYQTIPGWDTITNAADGVVGNDVEDRAAFEARRQASVALNGQGTLQSILAAVLAVPNVLDAYAVENNTSTTATIGGASVAAHSVFVSVAGGDSQAIGNAIWTKKSSGCGYSGNTTVTVLDTNYPAPQPSYVVRYQTPTPTPVYVLATITNSTLVPSNALAQIQAAVIAAFSGADGGSRARIGSTLYASRYYAGIAALGAWAQIVSVQIGLTSGNANSVAINIDQVPVIAASQISLALV